MTEMPKQNETTEGKGRSRARGRYTEEEKTTLLEEYFRLRDAGLGHVKASRIIGVSYVTVSKWVGDTEKRLTVIRATF